MDTKSQQQVKNLSGWIWGLGAVVFILALLNLLLLRSLCSDAWYVRLVGAPTSCGGNNNSAGMLTKGTQTLSISGNKLTLSDGGGTVDIDMSTLEGSPGPTGSNGFNGANGLIGATGAPGAMGPAGTAGPVGVAIA